MEQYIDSKKSFMLGLVSGIAIISTLGFVIFGGLFVKKELGGDNWLTNNSGIEDDGTAINDDGSGNPAPTQPDDTAKVDVKVASTDHIRGNKNAKITIVEFTDIQCPFCSRFHDTMKQVMAKYPNDVRWVLKHFPLESIHPYAKKAAMATECANEQNKFWEYTDKLYANQDSLNEQYLSKAAGELKLDIKKFDACLKSDKYANKVSGDLQQGQTYGVRGTPGSFINGKTIPGAVPFEQIEAMIKAEL